MKKILEVILDDNENIQIKSEYNPIPPLELLDMNPKLYDKLFKKFIRAFVMKSWRDNEFDVSQIVRLMSMAELASGAQPYQDVESLWTVMMHETLPSLDDALTAMKKPFGFKPDKVRRPIVMGDMSSFKMGDGLCSSIQEISGPEDLRSLFEELRCGQGPLSKKSNRGGRCS